MPIPVHVICGKCGSLDVRFRINERPPVEDNCGCGVYIVCANCSELTGIETINDWKEEQFPSRDIYSTSLKRRPKPKPTKASSNGRSLGFAG